jgi:ATP/maltotriose-dependent transcriptional regulator MalT
MLAIDTCCEKFSYETLSFLKKTMQCSASVFTWFDHISDVPTHFSDGLDEHIIDHYYDQYVENDPISHIQLIHQHAITARLTPALLEQEHTEKYQDFMQRYQFKDEVDIILWAAGAPVASIALLKMKDDSPFQSHFDLEQIRQFIQFNFELLPTIKKLNLRSQLKQQFNLTAKESLTAELLCQGYANKEIALQLCIEPATVKTHLINIFNKLEVNSRTQAVARISNI